MTDETTVMDPPAAGDSPGAIPSTPAVPGDTSGTATNGESIDLDSMTQEQLEAVLSGNGELPEAKPTAGNEPPPVQEDPNPDGDDIEQPPANSQPDAKPKRIRMNVGDLPETDINLMFQARDMVKTGQATDIKDAMLKLVGPTEPATPASEKPPGETTPPTVEAPPANDNVQAIKDRIEDLKKQRVEARTVEFNFEKADSLNDEIAAAMIELKDAERASTVSASTATEWARQEADTLAAVTRDFPDLRDEGSELYQEYAAQHALAIANGDPVFNSPDWSQKLVDRANNRLARLTGSASPAPQRQPAPVNQPSPGRQPVPPTKPSRPVGSLGGSGADGPPLNSQQLQSLIESADPEALEAALSAPDEASAASLLLQRRRR